MSSTIISPLPAVRIYQDSSAFGVLEEEWKALFERHGGWNVFLSWQWFSNWWSCFGTDKELRLLTLRHEGLLVGIVPMMIEGDGNGGRRLALIGDDRTTDYGDLLAAPEFVTPLCDALADVLLEGSTQWQGAQFRNIPATSPLLGPFVEAARQRGFRVEPLAVETCPVARLQPTWEQFLANLGKSHRHELRRKMRRAEGSGSQRLLFLAGPEETLSYLEDFLRLHRASNPEKAAFLDDGMASFFRKLSRSFAGEGWLRLNLMEMDGCPVAASMAFSRGDRILLYNSGLDPDYRSRSVGIALHAASIQQAISLGKEWYDFLRGNEHYKYDLGARDNPIYTLDLPRPASNDDVGEEVRG